MPLQAGAIILRPRGEAEGLWVLELWRKKNEDEGRYIKIKTTSLL